jgi:hypothetical protein
MDRQKIWFKKWVLGRRTIKEIAKEKKCSVSTVQRLFKIYLDNPPIPQIKRNDNCHLMIDGTYTSDFCNIYYFDNDLKHLQYFEIVKSESYLEFRHSLELLKASGLNIVSVTSDGDKGLIMALKEIFPGIIHQRCIIHVQRMALIYLTRFPKYRAGKDLRLIALELHRISDHEERREWVDRFKNWETTHHDFLNERSSIYAQNKLYQHYDIRRVRTLINNALPSLFYYLDDPQIPKSNNGLECRFSYLKNNLRIHRGLSNIHRRSFIMWYNWFKYND